MFLQAGWFFSTGTSADAALLRYNVSFIWLATPKTQCTCGPNMQPKPPIQTLCYPVFLFFSLSFLYSPLQCHSLSLTQIRISNVNDNYYYDPSFNLNWSCSKLKWMVMPKIPMSRTWLVSEGRRWVNVTIICLMEEALITGHDLVMKYTSTS